MPSQLNADAAAEICGSLNGLLADSLALYIKTKNFHWHVSGPNFREYHLLLDEQATKIFAVVDDMAERVRKIGGATLRSINQAAAMTGIAPNEADGVGALDMLAELLEDNRAYAASLLAAHEICNGHGDVATASLLEVWIDEADNRIWFLQETTRGASAGRS
jgi:starvation-inducible DNA-binding protein